MRTLPKLLLASGAALLGALPSSARAQLDINPPVPNVLLLIDTSGSMENMINGKRPEQAGASCTPGVPMPASSMNRWATLISVMTGSIENFSCDAVNRSSAPFKNEYALNGADPYDYKYYLPFHRILSNGCTAGPGFMPPQWDLWPAGAIKYHAYNDPNAPCAAPGWKQLNDGILDTFRDRVRFGLMTFDTLPDPGTGASGGLSNQQSGMNGLWSYYLNWQGGGAPATGNPPNCSLQTIEVGARNPAAPPWEGRLISFGPPTASLTDIQTTNDHIQEALIAMRPYGATPLAGMLADARDLLLFDNVHGSGSDPFFSGGCRQTFLILLSDGEPNLDLRVPCETGNGKCPYPRPHEIAHQLATNPDPNRRVKTFAVGFGLSSDNSGTDCKTLTPSDLTSPNGTCATAEGSLKACCTLGRIAFEGGTGRAYFADDPASLKSALSQVLATISAGSTSRTVPVFATASGTAGATNAAGFQFLTSFDVPIGGDLWKGNLERKRYVCETRNNIYKAWLQGIEENKGDSFHANVNESDPARPRRFFTVIGTKKPTGEIFSRRSIRPWLAADDGIGLYSGAVTGNNALLDGPVFASTVKATPEALEINQAAPPAACQTRLGTNNAQLCAERVVRWEVGESNTPAAPETRRKSPSCPECSVLGSIYHATPVTVGPPNAAIRDESYAVFAAENAKRPLVLYTATTDGQLHAFKVAASDPSDTFKVDSRANNELWSFLPPHVLPYLLPTYDQQALLLDGAPVVRDVVLERTQAQAIAGGGAGRAKWSTVLLAGGGAGGGFYYALDVTDPAKPKFLWQLSASDGGVPLFGQSTPTPAIATIALQDAAGGSKEVAVAILPGGSAPLKQGSCPRKQTSFPHLASPGSFAPRQAVRCWGDPGAATTGPARSLTIVRLDNGEVLMSFRGDLADGPALLGNRSKIAPFDSPIVGIPVPYPAQVGQVADRIYVGDADGTLWRVNLTSLSPQNWSVELAWDAYSMAGDTFAMGEPIQTPPVVSIDPSGNTVVLFSTGDQEMFASSAVQTRVWSLTERAVGNDFFRSENWVIPFTQGKRVTGPISLFDSVAYFATYTPPIDQNAACAYGFGSVWGVHYNKRWQDDTTFDPPLPAGAQNPFPQARYTCSAGDTGCAFDPAKLGTGVTYAKDQPPGTTVFGVAIAQTPTCFNETVAQDPFYGSVWTFDQTSRGEFRLVYQTGKGGSASEGSVTKTVDELLPSPKQFVRIDSWASVVE